MLVGNRTAVEQFIASGGVPVSGYVTALQSALTIDAAGIAGRGGVGGFSPGTSGSGGLDGSMSAIHVEP